MEYPKIPNIYKRQEGNNGNKLIEGAFSTPELEFLAGNDWVWTEKVDGTNIRIMWDGHSVTFGGRTDRANIPAHLVNRLNELFSGPDKEEIFEQTFGNTPVILFGEGFGEKIQSGGKYGPVDFILFDVHINDWWLRRPDVEGIASAFGIRVVPVIGAGSLYDAVKAIKQTPRSQLKDDALEGFVCRPLVEMRDRRNERIIVKVKCRDFPHEG